MRAYVLASLLALGSGSAAFVASLDAHADFDPGGRRKPGGKPAPKPPAGAKPAPTPPAPKPPAPGPGATKPATTAPDDGPERGRSPDALIARYSGIVLAQPGATFPLQRLAQLYRERDGNLKQLVADFEQRAQASGEAAWSAKVALAGILKIDGRAADAVKAYEAAIAERPKESAPLLALAQLEIDRGDQASARRRYEQALPLLKVAADIEQTRRTLMQLCLDLKDVDAARAHHAELVKRSQGSLFVRAELGRELSQRDMLELAEAELRELVKAASGDNRALAPALRDLGRVLARQKKTDEALTVLKRALSVAGGATGVRAEILAVMTEAYRAEGKLVELVEILEKEPGQDFQRLTTLGRILEETGQVDKALAAYRKALALDGAHVDTRVRVVHLLQTTGELELAIKEYEALIRSAPNASEYVFELCETLIQRGDRPKALRLLEELERRAGNDGDTLAAVADFYERVEERDKAMKVLQRLANAQTGDPTFLVDLGDRYYQAGDKKRALETWAKIPRVSTNRARASLTLGEVYLDHDMPTEALAALRDALSLEPDSLPTKKALAIALERTAPGTPQAAARFQEAVTLWEQMLAASGRDANLAREARTHIVSIWSITKELSARSAPLQARFAATPPDLEAGRLLAEVQRKLGQLAGATTTLRAIIAKAPGDEPSMLALERVLVQQHDLLGAIEVLEKLAELNPKAARQYYQRMAQYAAELYRDDDAIRYAAKAVELSPDDANGHQKLGDMYRKRQDIPNAIARYRQAIAKNDRLFVVYFDLAELLLSTGEVAEADRLFRRVVRASGDEELVARAARASMQINLGKGSLETLERELLPVAVGNPQKPMYRRLLVELYGAMTMPLVQKVRHGEDAAEVAKARAELTAIGTRAVKPLLDALGDEREAQQRIAIEVLAYVENKNAGPSLFNFATGQADRELRTRAMIAVGALRDPAMLPKLAQLLEPVLPPARGARGAERALDAAPAEQISVAAAWAVARTPGAKAEELLARMLDASSPDVRAVASIGLAAAPGSGARKHAPALVALIKAPEAGPRARAAALAALGELVQRGLPAPSELEQLTQGLLDAPDALLRRTALGASAQLALAGPGEGGARRGGADFTTAVDRAIAQAVFDRDPALRARAVAVSTLRLDRPRPGAAPSRMGDPLSVPDGRLDVDDMLRALAPAEPDDEAKARALVALEEPLRVAATSAVSTSAERAAVVGDALASQILAPFAPQGALPSELAARATAATRAVLEAAAPGFAGLARHPQAALRARAAMVIAREGSEASSLALARALEQSDAEAKRGILSAIEAGRPPGLVAQVARSLASDESWAVRVRAAETLASLGAVGSAREPAFAALEAAARGDRYALVREAALRSLHALDPARAAEALRRAAASDAEPRVRTLAEALLGGAEASPTAPGAPSEPRKLGEPGNRGAR